MASLNAYNKKPFEIFNSFLRLSRESETKRCENHRSPIKETNCFKVSKRRSSFSVPLAKCLSFPVREKMTYGSCVCWGSGEAGEQDRIKWEGFTKSKET